MPRSLKLHKLALLVLLLAISTPSSAEIYKWKDKNGNIIYSDRPPAGISAEKMKLPEQLIERPEKKDSPGIKAGPAKEKRPYRDITVIMYMTTWCPYCTRAKDYMNSIGVTLIEYDVDRDANKKREMLGKSGGGSGIPLIDIEGTIIKGFVPDAIKSAIEKKRNL